MAFLDDDTLQQTAGGYELPFQRLQRQEAANFLMQILGTLPLRQQEVLQLRFQSDLSYQDISEITHLSVTNVGVMIHNALKTLRARYAAVADQFVTTSRFNQKT